MSYQEISNTINPPLKDQIEVIDWLKTYNVTKINNYGDSIHFLAEKKVVRNILNIENRNDDSLFNYTIPENLRHIIEFIELDSKKKEKHTKINVHTASADDRYFGKESLINLYNVSYYNLNNSVSGASIEYQNLAGFYTSDLTLLQYANNQTINNQTIIIGNNNYYNMESQLDVQLMSQAGNGIKLWFWETPYWLYSFATEFFNSEDLPDIISMSWGWAEKDQCSIIDCQNITSQQ